MVNPSLEILYQLAQKEERKIIGLMSGTSLDGLDVALCTVRNHGPATKVNVDNFCTVPYSEEIKLKIRSIFAKQTINFQDLCSLNASIGRLHGTMVLQCLKQWDIKSHDIDIIASHGQTVYHSPRSFHQDPNLSNSTLQIGDGDHVALTSGIITISDFRQKHVAAEGDGAPLALYGDYFLFSKENENRIMLNIGGISNITCLFGDLDASKVFATDLGPGNTLIDAVVREYFNKEYDEDGNIAKNGQINPALLEALKAHDFFNLPFPKTTGPELFNLIYVKAAQKSSKSINISPSDIIATLTRFTAEIITHGISRIPNFQTFKIYTSGGGAHNPVLMGHLKTVLTGMEISTTDDLGISGDAKEAVLFASLANETICGRRVDFGDRKSIPSVFMGKISFPV